VLIRQKVPNPLKPKTKLSKGYTSNLITRIFFKKHIGSHFHFTFHLLEWIKKHPNKTYEDAINFWNYQNKNKEKFKKIYAETNRFEYNNFIKKMADQGYSLKQIIKLWEKHKRIRNVKCNEIVKKIIKLCQKK